MKQAEDALKESEAKFRRFYDSNMLPMAFWNVQGYVYDCNDAFAKLVGSHNRKFSVVNLAGKKIQRLSIDICTRRK